jgi:hypothetical protein
VKRSSIFGNLKEVLPSVEHRQHKRRNNRAETPITRRASATEGCDA